MPTDTYTYALGAVKTHVRSAAYDIGPRFNVSTVYGIGLRPDATSDHPKGLALDFMVYKDRAKGDQIVAYVKTNWARLGVKYVIWQQAIDEGSGFKPMENRGSDTANHRDHVHVSFTSSGTAEAYAGTTGGTTGGEPNTAMGGGLAALTNPNTWIRVLMFVAGFIGLAIMVWSLINNA